MGHLGRHFRVLSRRLFIKFSSSASKHSSCRATSGHDVCRGGLEGASADALGSLRGLATSSFPVRNEAVMPLAGGGGYTERPASAGVKLRSRPGLPMLLNSGLCLSSFPGSIMSRRYASILSSSADFQPATPLTTPRNHSQGFCQPQAQMIVARTLARGDRGFAKAVALAPQMQKPMRLRVYMGSPGVIGEPYKPPPPPLPILRRWFTKEGWRIRWQNVVAMLKTGFTLAKVRQKTKGYSQAKFYREATDAYKEINSALAQGDRSALRQLVTDNVLTTMKKELKHREQAWAQVQWELVGPIKRIRTLQGRLIGIDQKNMDTAFAQITLRIVSNQKFAAYDNKGKLVAGDPEKELTVEDIWVFERQLSHPELKWRLCGRLTV